MRHVKAEPTWITDQSIDLSSAVEELHGVSSQELNKILRDSENFTLQGCNEDGLQNKIDMERLARCLPVHLIAVLVSSGGDEIRMQYLLRGFRLLHSFSDLASRHNKLEQILLEEVRVTEQIMDLIFFTIVVLTRYKLDIRATGLFPLLHSALVACSFQLLAGYISSQWRDLVQVLIAHPENFPSEFSNSFNIQWQQYNSSQQNLLLQYHDCGTQRLSRWSGVQGSSKAWPTGIYSRGVEVVPDVGHM